MTAKLYLDILPQPDNTTCGPTCLHAIYRYFGDEIPLHQVVSEVPQIEAGGTLAVYLAVHALRRGYSATIYSYNLQIFDPTWANARGEEIAEKLRLQASCKKAEKDLQAHGLGEQDAVLVKSNPFRRAGGIICEIVPQVPEVSYQAA